MTEHLFTCDRAADRLDAWVVGLLPHLSRARVQALVKNGEITLNGETVRSSAKVRVGDVLRVIEPSPVKTEILAQDIPLTVLHEDADLIVIDKPAGIVVHPAVGNRDGTVVNALLHHCTGLSGIGGIE